MARNGKKFNGKIVFPLTVYGDDFEVNNPLGSRTGVNKEHTIYCNISGVPTEYASLLKNIFLLQLFKSTYKKITSLLELYRPVMQQILDLINNGIEITVEGKNYTVYIGLLNFSGDNLELHNVLGFNGSFNSKI